MRPIDLPYGRQTVDDADLAAVIEALRATNLTCGPRVTEFEAHLAARVEAGYASACSSGTAALHLVYAGLGFGPGDEIITTPITFSATAAAAYYVGASVRFADVDPRTGNLTPASVEPLITPRTKAIVAVHLGGLPVDLDDLAQLAKARGIHLIEDACHALGATYRGRPVGSGPGVATVFSFHPVKHITTAEGGAVVTHDAELKRRVDRLRQHGVERDPARMLETPAGPWAYEVQELGFNYRLSDLQCALGITQLAKLDRFVARRRELAARYRIELAARFGDGPDAAVQAPVELDDRTSAYHLFAAAIDFERCGVTRARVATGLAAAGIGTQVHYIPLIDHPLHATRCPGERDRDRPGTATYYARTLSLPLFPAMTDADVGRVVHALHQVLGVPQ
jgi:perosamine synthetase